MCIKIYTNHTFDFRDFRQKDVAKFHVQLAMSMMFMLIVFVAGIDRTENRAGCITVGVLLHYLILVTWMWMAAEAVLLFQKLVIFICSRDENGGIDWYSVGAGGRIWCSDMSGFFQSKSTLSKSLTE